MKNYLYVLLMSFALTTIQSQGLEYGLKAGLNLNSSGDITNILDEYSSIGQTKETINGFNFGVFLQLKLAMLYLRPEIHFSKFETSYDALTVGKSRLEAPVSVGFKFLPFLSAFAGPTYRYGLSGKNDYYTIEPLKGESTLGLHLGARLHLGKLGIDARIERGISENEVKLLSDRNVNIGNIDQRTTVLSVGLSYAF